MTRTTTYVVLTFFVLLNLGLTINQDIDAYFLGIPYRKTKEKQIAFISSSSLFDSEPNDNFLPLLYFQSKFINHKTIDPSCDSINIIITTSFYFKMNERASSVEDTKIIYHYSSRKLQMDKFAVIEKQLLEKKYRTAYITVGDENNKPESRMKGVEFMLSKKEFPKISLLHTTQDNYFEVRLEYSKARK